MLRGGRAALQRLVATFDGSAPDAGGDAAPAVSRPRRHINDTRTPGSSALPALSARIVDCRRCARLTKWCATVARDKRAAYAGDDYWGRRVPGFGDPAARLVVVGLAPGAHGANRTGRVFTGDRSGDWLYRALHRAGFANQPTSTDSRRRPRAARRCVTVCVRCAPPDNKPTPAERDACLPFLVDELRLLDRARVLVCLGAFAWDGVLRALRRRPSRRVRNSRHGAEAASARTRSSAPTTRASRTRSPAGSPSRCSTPSSRAPARWSPPR